MAEDPFPVTGETGGLSYFSGERRKIEGGSSIKGRVVGRSLSGLWLGPGRVPSSTMVLVKLVLPSSVSIGISWSAVLLVLWSVSFCSAETVLLL